MKKDRSHHRASNEIFICWTNKKFRDSWKVSICEDGDAEEDLFYCVAWPKKEETCFVGNLINIGGKSFLLHNEEGMDEMDSSLPSDFGLFYFRFQRSSYSLPGFLIHYRLVLLICKSPKGFSLLWFGKQKTVDWNSLVVSWLSSIGGVILPDKLRLWTRFVIWTLPLRYFDFSIPPSLYTPLPLPEQVIGKCCTWPSAAHYEF